jgi:hypothetical protein
VARRIVAAVAVASVLSGCAHVHRIDPALAGPELGELNRALERRRASVEVLHSVPHRLPVKLRAERVRVAADSTHLTLLLEPGDIEAMWGEPAYGVRRDTTLCTSTITRVTTTNRLRGTLDGTLLGLGIGLAFGAVLGSLIDDPWPAETRAMIGGLFFGMVGTGAGLATGAIVGSREVYVFVSR